MLMWVSASSVCVPLVSYISSWKLTFHLPPPPTPPSDPTQWTEDQVYRWAEWVAQEFNLATVNLQALRGVTGHQLCSFGQRQFQELAYIKEHGLTLQHFLERIKAISVGKSITLCDSEPMFHDVGMSVTLCDSDPVFCDISRWYFGMR